MFAVAVGLNEENLHEGGISGIIGGHGIGLVSVLTTGAMAQSILAKAKAGKVEYLRAQVGDPHADRNGQAQEEGCPVGPSSAPSWYPGPGYCCDIRYARGTTAAACRRCSRRQVR